MLYDVTNFDTSLKKKKKKKKKKIYVLKQCNVVVSEKQILDWNIRLSLMVFPKDQRRLNLWPQNPTDFKYMFNT
jgi:hypothetical protein